MISFNQADFRTLCQQASSTIQFDEASEQLRTAISAIDGATDIAPFLRVRLAQLGQDALNLIEQRRTDPTQLLGAMQSYLARNEYSAEEHAALENWFIKVAYRPELQLDDEFMNKVTELWQKDPALNEQQKLKELEKRFKDVEKFARSSVDLDVTLSSVTGLERILRSYPFPQSVKSALFNRIGEARRIVLERRARPINEILKQALETYEEIIKRAGDRRLDQDASKELQLNLFGARRVLEKGAFDETMREELAETLERIEEEFEPVRYLSSTTIFKTVYEPLLGRMENEVDRTINFEDVSQELILIQERSRAGKTKGVDRLEFYHQNSVRDAVAELRQRLEDRYRNPDALKRELQLADEQVAELNRRPIIRRHSLIRAQKYLKACIAWASAIDRDAVPKLSALMSKCNELWNTIDSRYQSYVASLGSSLDAFQTQISSVEDFKSALEELVELHQSIADRDNGLHSPERHQLLQHCGAIREAFYTRLNNVDEIKEQLNSIDQAVTNASRNLRRFAAFDSIDLQAHAIGYRIGKGRFTAPEKAELISRIRKLYASIRILIKRREQYLAERAAHREALFGELREAVSECMKVVQDRPGDPNSWEMLKEADRQLREERVLSNEQRESLRNLLDQAFAHIKEHRAKFAKEASLIYAEYLDEIQDIFQPLQRTSPSPSREDAFEAIEGIKPIRARLREERRLLRAQRDELFSTLRTVSDAISEILDRPSEEMQRNLNHMRRRFEELRQGIQSVKHSEDLSKMMIVHKNLYADLRAKELSLEGRAECRTVLEALWTEISEKKQDFGRSRFDAQRVDLTLARLEDIGHFIWINNVPHI